MNSKIGNVTLNYDFCSAEDSCAGNDIYNRLLDIVKSDKDIEGILLEETDGELLYHLSDIRKNLLSWYPFDKHASILEIGAECGALTGLFCERTARVVAVDQSKVRSEINAYRNNYDNLEIIVGNIADIKTEEKFDVVTLIGTLAYAADIISSANPFADMISIAKGMLKPGGHLIVAIANKYGLKYWAGAKEDNTGNLFDSIQGYGEDTRVRTFSRKELTDIILTSGLKEPEFYYPTPDFKLPLEVISAEYIKNYHDMYGHTPSYDRDRVVLFNEAKVTDSLIRDGMYEDFANAFLVITKKEV